MNKKKYVIKSVASQPELLEGNIPIRMTIAFNTRDLSNYDITIERHSTKGGFGYTLKDTELTVTVVLYDPLDIERFDYAIEHCSLENAIVRFAFSYASGGKISTITVQEGE